MYGLVYSHEACDLNRDLAADEKEEGCWDVENSFFCGPRVGDTSYISARVCIDFVAELGGHA